MKVARRTEYEESVPMATKSVAKSKGKPRAAKAAPKGKTAKTKQNPKSARPRKGPATKRVEGKAAPASDKWLPPYLANPEDWVEDRPGVWVRRVPRTHEERVAGRAKFMELVEKAREERVRLGLGFLSEEELEREIRDRRGGIESRDP